MCVRMGLWVCECVYGSVPDECVCPSMCRCDGYLSVRVCLMCESVCKSHRIYVGASPGLRRSGVWSRRGCGLRRSLFR